jgi:hypothetical protein
VEEKVWLNAGSANRAPSNAGKAFRTIDWIFTRVTPLLGEHDLVAIFNLKVIRFPIP